MLALDQELAQADQHLANGERRDAGHGLDLGRREAVAVLLLKLLELLKQKGKRWESEKPELLRYVVKMKELFAPSAPVPTARAATAADDRLG